MLVRAANVTDHDQEESSIVITFKFKREGWVWQYSPLEVEEFEASLGLMASLRLAWATELDHISKHQKQSIPTKKKFTKKVKVLAVPVYCYWKPTNLSPLQDLGWRCLLQAGEVRLDMSLVSKKNRELSGQFSSRAFN